MSDEPRDERSQRLQVAVESIGVQNEPTTDEVIALDVTRTGKHRVIFSRLVH